MIADTDIFLPAAHLFFQRHAVMKMLCAASFRRTERASAAPFRIAVRTGKPEIKRNALNRVSVPPGEIVFQSPDSFHRAGRNDA